MIVYLDIETSFEEELTVVGVWRADRGLLQLVGSAIAPQPVREALEGVGTICTFNGDRFDLPVLRRTLGLDLLVDYHSLDLSVECRRVGFRGGLKAIEASLSIARRSNGLNGYDAMVLWDRWLDGDRDALETLLAYNAEDVYNLVRLERRLRADLSEIPVLPQFVRGAV